MEEKRIFGLWLQVGGSIELTKEELDAILINHDKQVLADVIDRTFMAWGKTSISGGDIADMKERDEIDFPCPEQNLTFDIEL